MNEKNGEDFLGMGIEAVENGDTLIGLVHLEKIPPGRRTPLACSYLAYCLAKERDQVKEAIALCKKALEEEPGNSLHYLNAGRVFVLSGQKKEAIRMFRDGLLFQENQSIRTELDNLGWRNPPIFISLSRENILNKFFGLLRKKFLPHTP